MLNQIVLVGRLTETPSLENKNGKELSKITLKVPRSFKNEQGEYENDYIDVYLYNQIATNTSNYCKKDDIIGVKGRIQTLTGGENHPDFPKETIVVADKVTFLSSKSE